MKVMKLTSFEKHKFDQIFWSCLENMVIRIEKYQEKKEKIVIWNENFLKQMSGIFGIEFEKIER